MERIVGELVVSEEWADLFETDVDLDRAFAMLASTNHWHANTLRGKIRALQLAPNEAIAYLHLAIEGYRESGSPEHDFRRVFHAHDLLCGATRLRWACGGPKPAETPAALFLLEPREPWQAEVQSYHRSAQLAILGDYESAYSTVVSVIDTFRGQAEDHQPAFILAAAICSHQVGDGESTRWVDLFWRSFDRLETNYSRLRNAAAAMAFFQSLEKVDAAIDAYERLSSIKCHHKSTELYVQRARIFAGLNAYVGRPLITG